MARYRKKVEVDEVQAWEVHELSGGTWAGSTRISEKYAIGDFIIVDHCGDLKRMHRSDFLRKYEPCDG